MMAVDEPRQQDLITGADDRRRWILPMQFVIGADGDDHAIFLQDGAVLDLVPGETILHAGDGGTRADQAGGHSGFSFRSPGVAKRASCSMKARSTSSRRRSVRCMRRASASREKRLRGRFMSIGTIVFTRPGRDVNTTTRSARATASSI